jgi:hypothetical protein
LQAATGFCKPGDNQLLLFVIEKSAVLRRTKLTVGDFGQQAERFAAMQAPHG